VVGVGRTRPPAGDDNAVAACDQPDGYG
jgi:hypothetical protein